MCIYTAGMTMPPQPQPSAKSGLANFPDGDAVRTLIVSRAAELGLTYSSLSQTVERNETYIHQFLFRGTPKRLSEDVRQSLARTLGVREDDLRGTIHGQQRRLSPTTRASLMSPTTMLSATEPDLPVFAEDGAIVASSAVGRAPRPRSLDAVPGSFGVWINRGRGRLNPGDLIFVHAGQPPRDGDLVVVITDDRIVAIGDLVRRSEDHVSVQVVPDGKPEGFLLRDVRVLKVHCIQLP